MIDRQEAVCQMRATSAIYLRFNRHAFGRSGDSLLDDSTALMSYERRHADRLQRITLRRQLLRMHRPDLRKGGELDTSNQLQFPSASGMRLTAIGPTGKCCCA